MKHRKPPTAGILSLLFAAALLTARGEEKQAASTACRVPDTAAFDLARKYQESAGGQTLVVMHDGKSLFESYDNCAGTEQRHMLAMRTIPILQRNMGDIVNARWLPGELSMAAGSGKQRLYLIPSLKLVIARQGPLSAARKFSDIQFLSRLLRGHADKDVSTPATAGSAAENP